jgi:hypothetical protein
VGGFKCKIDYLESLAVTRFSKKLIAPTYLLHLLLSLLTIKIPMTMPVLLVILLITNLVFINIFVEFPVIFFHLLSSLFWSILGMTFLAILSYFFGE